MSYTPQQALSQLQPKRYAPVYFLQGEAPYYIALLLDYVEANVLRVVEQGFKQGYLVAAQHYPLLKVIAKIYTLHQKALQHKGVDSPAMSEGTMLKALVFKLMHAP